MTQEEKQLLLKDLCARLPYGVIATDSRHGDGRITSIEIYNPDELDDSDILVYYFDFDECGRLEDCKPYLRPMSSMTEEEEILFRCELPAIAKTDAQLVAMRMELFLKGHLDFNHLIEKGLALEAPEGMYNSTNNA